MTLETKLAGSVTDQAKRIGLGRATLWKKIKEGTGPRVTRIGRRTLILDEDLTAWLREQRDKAVRGTL